METLAIETGSVRLCPEHALSGFLEDFHDKNSHLFPSTSNDLTFTTPVELDINPYQNLLGTKRKIDALSYDSFSSWTEDLFLPEDNELEIDSQSSVYESIEQCSDTYSSSFTIVDSDSPSGEHVDKKRKLDCEELALYQTDARSRSPPNFGIMDDTDIPTLPLNPSSPSQSDSVQVIPKTTTTLDELKKSIQTLDFDACQNFKESFLRLANHTKTGDNSPFSAFYQVPYSLSDQITVAQDMLSVKMLFGTVAPIKSERSSRHNFSSYYPVAPAPGMFPYINSYLYPTGVSITSSDSLNTKCSLGASDSMLYGGNNFFTRNYYSPSQTSKKYLNSQNYVSTGVIPQTLYSHQAVHVL